MSEPQSRAAYQGDATPRAMEGPRTYQSAWQWNEDGTSKCMTAEEWLREEAHVDRGMREGEEQDPDEPDRAGIMDAIAAEIATLRRDKALWAEQATKHATPSAGRAVAEADVLCRGAYAYLAPNGGVWVERSETGALAIYGSKFEATASDKLHAKGPIVRVDVVRSDRAAQATPAEGAERPHWHPGWTQRLSDAYALIDEAGETPIVASSLTGRLFVSLCFVSSILNEFAPEPIQPAGAADRTRGGAGAPDRVETIVFGLRHGHGYASLSPEACALLVAHIDALEQECATLLDDAARLDWLESSAGWAWFDYKASDCDASAHDMWPDNDNWRGMIDAARAGRPAGEGDR